MGCLYRCRPSLVPYILADIYTNTDSIDNNNSAFITGLANCGTSFFAGFVVFSMLGYLAQAQGVDVSEVAEKSTGLAFVTFPTAISKLPALNALFGVVFFVALLTLGIDSAFALQEAFTTGFHDKWHIPPEKLIVTGPGDPSCTHCATDPPVFAT